MTLSPQAMALKETVNGLYRSSNYFKFLSVELRDLDDQDFKFGSRYRCIRSFCANAIGPHVPDFGRADFHETMWFIGYDYFAWDGVHALFFHDGHRLRDFVFSDAQHEIEGRINKAFKREPQAYFQLIDDDSENGKALAALREELLAEKRAKWPRFAEREERRR